MIQSCRPWTGVCHVFITCVCLLLQDLLQSCSRGGRGIVEDMCNEQEDQAPAARLVSEVVADLHVTARFACAGRDRLLCANFEPCVLPNSRAKQGAQDISVCVCLLLQDL